MSMYWHSTLVPLEPLFLPSPAQVQRFFESAVAIGAFGGPLKHTLLTIDKPGGSIEGRTSRTGERFSATTPKRLELSSAAEIATHIGGRNHYFVEIGSELHGSKPVWSPSCEPGWVAIMCEAFGQVVSTSDIHDDGEGPAYGEPCSADARLGRFTHPHAEKLIEVPGAGCASFVVDFNFGKFIFPPKSMTALSLISSEYVAAARACFEQDFVEGCYWD
jgi:hypothetical protein